MIQTMDMARTHEIMARFRPIAPKPQLPQAPPMETTPPPGKPSIHIRTRASRARKRARTGDSSHVCCTKKQRTLFPVFPPSSDASHPFPHLGLSIQGFTHGFPPVFPFPGHGFHGEKPLGTPADLLTLSLLPCSTSLPAPTDSMEKKLDLNLDPLVIPVEKDLLQELQKPKVIQPQPVRPVGSSISVGCISEEYSVPSAPVCKKPEEVEEEMESEALPTVVSDSNNRVRLMNSAYKEMVGQPECLWLDSMVSNGGLGLKAASKRINGEVMLDLSDSSVPVSSNGFSCKVKIEWGCGGRKTFINAPCDVMRLSCESKDYLFTWRFHTSEASEADCKA